MALSHTGFFLLRSPLYPVDYYRQILEKSLPDLQAAHPDFLYALHIASRELLKELERFTTTPHDFTEKKVAKLRKSLYKYWVRACTRSTPYGLFAGCITGNISAHTQWQLNSITAARQHIRLDMDYFTRICHYLQQQPAIAPQLRYYPNNSIYQSGNKYRYAEFSIVNNKRKYMLTAVPVTDYLKAALQAAANGATMQQVADSIMATDNAISNEEAMSFVTELISAQLLIAETEPKITDVDNLGSLIDRLSTIEDVETLRTHLLHIQQLLQQQNLEPARLVKIQEACSAAFPLDTPKDLLQVDLFKTGTCTIGEQLLTNLLEQVSELTALCHGYTKGGSSDLSAFAERFRERYDGAEVALCLVLDTEAGIGYGQASQQSVHAPFVEDIQTNGPQQPTTVSWSKYQQYTLEKYEQFLQTGAAVNITTDELKAFGDPNELQLASSSYLFGSLLAESAAHADSGEFSFVFQSAGGPSAANLIGRFCSGDPVLAEKMKAALAQEEASAPDAVFAEIVHFPEARAANVLIRPSLRQFEIPYIGVPGVPQAYQLPVDDLLVSVKGNEVILRSARLNKRVYPRLSSAHNYSYNSLPVYKFLCDLQHQSLVSNLAWDWGVLNARPQLPRVTYKNIIVSRACWNIQQKEKEPEELTIKNFMGRYQLPGRVVLTEADNELLLDLSALLAVEILADHLRKHGQARLREFLSDSGAGVLRDGAGNVYAHELLIPLSFTKAPLQQVFAQPVTKSRQEHASPIRAFAPGSEWMYLKIYCGYRVAEELLSGYFADQLPIWNDDQRFEQFFFLRYADPHPHIRLRFLNSRQPHLNDGLLHEIQEYLAPYIANGLVHKIQTDTYVRELERYAAQAMEASEALFWHDSYAVINIISMLDGVEGEEYRWKLALRGMHTMLDDFGLTLTQRKKLLGSLREGFLEEFGGAALLHKQLNDKYRKYQQEIASYMHPEQDDANDIAEAIACFTERSAHCRPVAAQIRETCGSTETYTRIVASHLHMFINRLFVGKQRKHELVLYHFLEKFYLSQLAMEAAAK
ncbi:thiopeptide-type bacteriocin biosynthesis domain-containing protein [Chitinophaga jiangningensis]|uniref:Thiopeptide-type bacteriocin biosynthesis domain-containing protein n=1 Tax=Chitinophaga jiangningensis TaxID=1419482 RepID=A0A1M7N3Z9_9BACT|nr:lantibiotic dehydratase [Chitinophaga jiangningensis]SHM98151.1 thiopeptide-type bacteriocin biosynthesis domain-containing protein [Chitinophaga jiangningensis]